MGDAGAPQRPQQLEIEEPKIKKSKRSAARKQIDKLKHKFLSGFKYTLLLTLSVHLAKLVIGCLGVHKCPVDENIPLFLILAGAVGILSKMVTYVKGRFLETSQLKYIEDALYTIEIISFLLGTYSVYKQYKPSFHPEDGAAYCNKTTYMFAFVYITIIYSVLLAVIIGFICFLICVCFCIGYAFLDDDAPDPESQIPYADEGESIDHEEEEEDEKQKPEPQKPHEITVEIKTNDESVITKV